MCIGECYHFELHSNFYFLLAKEIQWKELNELYKHDWALKEKTIFFFCFKIQKIWKETVKGKYE